MDRIYSKREQSKIRKEITKKRVETLIEPLMSENNVDMWIVLGGDFNDDPVLPFLLSENPIDFKVLAFVRGEEGFGAYWNAKGHSGVESVGYESYTERGETWEVGLERLIKERAPRVIALNTSSEFHILDGVTSTLYDKVKTMISSPEQKIVTGQEISMRYMEHRLPEEMKNYENAAGIARELIAEAFSRELITPGVTTTADVRWHMRQRMTDIGVTYTWGPNVDLQRQGSGELMIGTDDDDTVILPGDLLHCDFGIGYLQLETDMQYLAYVLKEGETEPPKGLIHGFEECHKFQKIYMDVVKPDVTGNEIKREMMKRAEASGLEAMVYSHPIGFHVHSVGPSMGQFGKENDIPKGEWTLRNNTCYAMEQNVQVEIPEWAGQKVYIFREEDVALINGKIEVIGKLQDKLWTI